MILLEMCSLSSFWFNIVLGVQHYVKRLNKPKRNKQWKKQKYNYLKTIDYASVNMTKIELNF